MKLSETAEFVGKINIAYPNSFRAESREQVQMTISMWHSYYGDMPYDIMCEALKTYIDSASYPPTIHSVKEVLGKMYTASENALFEFGCEKELAEHMLQVLDEDDEVYESAKEDAQKYNDPEYRKGWRMRHEYIIEHTKKHYVRKPVRYAPLPEGYTYEPEKLTEGDSE